MVTLSHEMFPHIVETIVKLASWEVKLAFRLTSKLFLDKVDSGLCRHVILGYRSKPRSNWDALLLEAFSYTFTFPDWPTYELVLLDDAFRKELPVRPRNSSKRWLEVLEKIKILDIHVSRSDLGDEAMKLLDCTGCTHALFVRRKCSVDITLGAIHVIDVVHIANETEQWDDAGIWFTPLEIEAPCLTFLEEEASMHSDDEDDTSNKWSPIVAHIVNIDIDPFYDDLHFRPVEFLERSEEPGSNSATSLWVFFLIPDLDGGVVVPADEFQESFVSNVVKGLLFTSYRDCNLVGLEKLPPRLLGLPETTSAEDLPELLSKELESLIKSYLADIEPDYDKGLIESYVDYVSLCTLANLEDTPCFGEFLKYQGTWTSREANKYPPGDLDESYLIRLEGDNSAQDQGSVEASAPDSGYTADADHNSDEGESDEDDSGAAYNSDEDHESDADRESRENGEIQEPGPVDEQKLSAFERGPAAENEAILETEPAN